MNSPSSSARGISLIEIMVALAVLGIIVGLAAPSLADLLNRRRVQAVAEQISADIAFARAETALRPQSLTLYFQSKPDLSCYSMGYYAAGGGCKCATQLVSACWGNVVEFKTARVPASTGVSFTTSSADGKLNFDPPQLTISQLAATPNGKFSINVVGARGGKLSVQVNQMGRIKTCTPDGSMPGVQTCN